LTQSEKVDYLSRYCKVSRTIDHKVNLINNLYANLGKITPSYEPTVRGGSIHRHRDHDLIDKITDLQADLRADVGLMVDDLVDILRVIRAVDDDQLALLLQCRYINGHTWPKVAAAMEVCPGYVYRLHHRALEAVMI